MTTLTEHIIVVGAENRPPMLEKSMYDSWASRIRLFIKGKKNGRMMLNSIDEGVRLGLIQRFYQLINDMHTIGMTMQQVQVNTKFLNALPSEWSKFVTDVKLAKSLYTTYYDQLYAYLSQHERHSNEVRIMRERYPDPLALVANSQTLYNPSQSLQHSVPSMHQPPQQFTPVYAATNHQQPHHTLVNPIQQLVSLQPYISQSVTQQSQAQFPQLDSSHDVPTFQPGEDPIDFINKAMAFLSAVASRGIATTSRGNYATGQPRVVKFYNCQGEGHMTEDLDVYDSNCDDISSAKAVLMDVQEMTYSEQTHIVDFPNNKINSDINIIPYSQYLQESQDAGIQDTNSSAPNDLLVLSLVEQMIDHVANLNKEN
ncbi:hypothetical protein Tco_1322873 [Tanacetum coccineum]